MEITELPFCKFAARVTARAARAFTLLAVLGVAIGMQAQSGDFKVLWDHNYVKNSDFVKDADNSTKVTDWTFTPEGSSHLGWKKDVVLIYGENLFVDRILTHTATPALTEGRELCPHMGKLLRFKYNCGNTGEFAFIVTLGEQKIGTFTRWGLGAASIFTPDPGIKNYSFRRLFFPTGMVPGTDQKPLWNNVWHEVLIYLPEYTTGKNLNFIYTRQKDSDSRQIRLDDVGLYEMLPTPKPKQQVVNTKNCETDTYDLTTLTPDDGKYTYAWYRDTHHTQKVENPQAATIGSYYLFAEGCEAYSYPSAVVRVTKPDDCCGTNIIHNGDFQKDFNSWVPYNPKNDYAIVDRDNYKSAINAWPTKDAEMIKVPEEGDKWMKLHCGGFKKTWLAQKTTRACAYDPKRLEFDLVVEKNGNVDYPFAIYLGTMIDRNTSGRITKIYNGVKIFEILAETGRQQRWKIQNKAEGVTVRVKNLIDGREFVNPLTYADGLLQKNWENKTYRYRVSAIVSGETAKKIKSDQYRYLAFEFDRLVRYHLDNISLVNLPPIAEEPKMAIGTMDCPSTTFNLTTVEPDVRYPERAHKFQWYSDEQGTKLVADPEAVPEGVYYMKTISTCSGCESETLTKFEVKQSCPTVSGTLYSNYDGGDYNGNLGTNGGGMFAHLVHGNMVVATAPIGDDGKYSLTGEVGANYKVIISAKQTPVKKTITKSELNPNYAHADYAPIASNGISKTRSLQAYERVTNIDFGVQSPPIASDISRTEINKGAGYSHPIAQLYGVDDDPEWNDGKGQTVIFTALDTIQNGELLYDGSPVVANKEYPNYDPAKLTFKTKTKEEAKLAFKYKYKDRAGAQSPIDGVVHYVFKKDASSIDEVTATAIQVYADGIGNIVIDNAGEEPVSARFVDAAGRVLASRELPVGVLARVPMPGKGVYIVTLNGQKTALTRRVIVK